MKICGIIRNLNFASDHSLNWQDHCFGSNIDTFVSGGPAQTIDMSQFT